jgi:hypothetical protein
MLWFSTTNLFFNNFCSFCFYSPPSYFERKARGFLVLPRAFTDHLCSLCLLCFRARAHSDWSRLTVLALALALCVSAFGSGTATAPAPRPHFVLRLSCRRRSSCRESCRGKPRPPSLRSVLSLPLTSSHLVAFPLFSCFVHILCTYDAGSFVPLELHHSFTSSSRKHWSDRCTARPSWSLLGNEGIIILFYSTGGHPFRQPSLLHDASRVRRLWTPIIYSGPSPRTSCCRPCRADKLLARPDTFASSLFCSA